MAWKDKFFQAAITVLVTSDTWSTIYGFTKKIWCSSAITGEARTILETVRWDFANGLQAIESETDSLILHHALTGSTPSWDISSSVAAILHLYLHFRQLFFLLPPRSANYFANIIVKLSLQNLLPGTFFTESLIYGW